MWTTTATVADKFNKHKSLWLALVSVSTKGNRDLANTAKARKYASHSYLVAKFCPQATHKNTGYVLTAIRVSPATGARSALIALNPEAPARNVGPRTMQRRYCCRDLPRCWPSPLMTALAFGMATNVCFRSRSARCTRSPPRVRKVRVGFNNS